MAPLVVWPPPGGANVGETSIPPTPIVRPRPVARIAYSYGDGATPIIPPTFPDAKDLAEGSGLTRSFASVTTTAGDWLVVEIVVEDTAQPQRTPSCTGLTFTEQINSGTVGSRPRCTIWTAPDASGGTRTVDLTASGSAGLHRARLTVVRGSGGPGGKTATPTGRTVALSRTQRNSAVFMAVGDWSVGAVGTPSWIPLGTTVASQQGTGGTYVFGRLDDAGAPGTDITGLAVPAFTTPAIAVLEMLGGSGSASAVTLTPATGTWSAITVTPTPGQVALTLTPATGTWSGVAVTPTPGQVAVTLTPAAGTWTAVPLTVVAQVALTPAIATWAAVTVVATPVVTITPATASWAAVAVTPTPGQTARTITPATATWSAIAVTPTPGQVALTLTPATASWAAVAVSPVPQPVNVTATPATATWSALALSLSTPGAQTLTPATATWAAVAVTPTPGQTSRTITPATGTWSAVAVVPVSQVALTPANASWTAVTVSPVPGQTSRTLTAATATWAAVPLGVSGPSLVTVTPAVLTWSAVALDIGAAGRPGIVYGTAAGAGGAVAGTSAAGSGASTTTAASINERTSRAGEVIGNVV